ncbi:MAG: CvpA family protein [Acetobacteraceae bacterium]|nr:CvpA family protein [Acetobacteraceae bacterium]
MPTDSLIVDGAVAALLVLSAVLASLRGFVHETLGMLGWIGAIAAALAFYPLAAPLLSGVLSEPWMRASVAAFAIFLVALVALSLIARWLARLVRNSALGPIDRALGFLFGLARGAVVVVVAYIGAAWLLPAAQCPPWLAQARTLDAAEPLSDYAFSLLPRDLGIGPPPPLCRNELSRQPTAADLARPPRPQQR